MRVRSVLLFFVAVSIGISAGLAIRRPPLGGGADLPAPTTARASRAPDEPLAADTGARAEVPAGVRQSTEPGTPAPGSSMNTFPAEENRTIAIFKQASPSVVFITSSAVRRRFFTMDVERIPQGSGSGFVWDDEGHIVTNFHVIEQGDAFSVTLGDQTTWDAKIIGRAPDKDLAVLEIKAPAKSLIPLELGRSNDLQVGQTVLAVGNPFGLDHSLTVGVLSALGRELTSPSERTIHDVIQTDAAINPGNSGGPLLDSRGRLIGVNTAIFSPSGASAGIGFAIPVDTVRDLVPVLIERGHPVILDIGASFVSDRFATQFGIRGIAIAEVAPGGTADRAGLAGVDQDRFGNLILGDIIVAVDGSEVATRDALLHAFETTGEGGTIALTVTNGRRQREVRVKLEAIE